MIADLDIKRKNIMQEKHLEILLESIDSKFQLTIEAFSSLNAKIDRVRDELG